MRTLHLSISFGASLSLLSLLGCVPGGPIPQLEASTGSGGSAGDGSSVSTAAGGGTATTGGDTRNSSASSGGAGGSGGDLPGSLGVVQLALGVGHSCARTAAGALYCWGNDGLKGTLGSGSTIMASSVPLQVRDPTGLGYLAGVTDVAAGLDHTCAILSGGTLVCFGYNIVGQLGNGSSALSSIPVTVKGVDGQAELTGVTKVACGSYFTCAIAGDGVYCWGLGRLGDGTIVGSEVPVRVLDADGSGPFKDAVDLAAGQGHVCIRKSDKTLHCFGNNANGQLGIGSTMDGLLPAQVNNLAGQAGFLAGVDEIARSGDSHSCARLGGAVACWGDGGMGELGASAPAVCSDPCAKVPMLVPGIDPLNPAVEITSGSEHTCARLADSSVVCWGSNTSSQLGATATGPCLPGNLGSCSMKPVTVTTPSRQTFFAAHVVSGSGVHTCAIAPNSSVWCWGDNTFGQLGDGTNKNSIYPVRVLGL